jgi:hypothetical protein
VKGHEVQCYRDLPTGGHALCVKPNAPPAALTQGYVITSLRAGSDYNVDPDENPKGRKLHPDEAAGTDALPYIPDLSRSRSVVEIKDSNEPRKASFRFANPLDRDLAEQLRRVNNNAKLPFAIEFHKAVQGDAFSQDTATLAEKVLCGILRGDDPDMRRLTEPPLERRAVAAKKRADEEQASEAVAWEHGKGQTDQEDAFWKKWKSNRRASLVLDKY